MIQVDSRVTRKVDSGGMRSMDRVRMRNGYRSVTIQVDS